MVVPEAVGGKTVVGQLTVDRATETGFVTAYGCDDVPAGGASLARLDVNFLVRFCGGVESFGGAC